jgi:pantoate--beta-alanine ligase
MIVTRTVEETRHAIATACVHGKTIGLVPTMGYLHEGHLSLVRKARAQNDIVVVSIFVNPAQFGPEEDYLRYPRPFNKDAKACREAGADFLFAPRVEDMYPEGYATYIAVEKMSEQLCGAFRPNHFRGVATVVAKLFNSALPDRAYFGMKDYQQMTILKRMVKDLNFPVTVVPCPIVRERSGLALSSRNQFLSAEEHDESTAISKALASAGVLIRRKKLKNSVAVIQFVAAALRSISSSRIDYIAVCDPETLQPVKHAAMPVLIAVAVRVGKTRLIDNILVNKS